MSRRLITIAILFITCLLTLAFPAQAETITVQAAAQQDKLYVGDPFHYQIIINGHESEGNVDLAPLHRYSPQSSGGRIDSRNSVIIINRRRRSESQRRYLMDYLLTATEPGQLTIPAVTVEIAGQQYRTNPVQLAVLEPKTTDKLLLQAELSETTRCSKNWVVPGTTLMRVLRSRLSLSFATLAPLRSAPLRSVHELHNRTNARLCPRRTSNGSVFSSSLNMAQ